MQLPKTIKVGRTTYSVQQPKSLPRTALGHIDYGAKTISVAYYFDKIKLSKDERSDTFWHELTHAILHDMNSRLVNDESFVTRFAYRLNNAINSAKF